MGEDKLNDNRTCVRLMMMLQYKKVKHILR